MWTEVEEVEEVVEDDANSEAQTNNFILSSNIRVGWHIFLRENIQAMLGELFANVV